MSGSYLNAGNPRTFNIISWVIRDRRKYKSGFWVGPVTLLAWLQKVVWWGIPELYTFYVKGGWTPLIISLPCTLKCGGVQSESQDASSVVVAVEGTGCGGKTVSVMKGITSRSMVGGTTVGRSNVLRLKFNSVTGQEKYKQKKKLQTSEPLHNIGIFSWTFWHSCYKANIFTLDHDWMFYPAFPVKTTRLSRIGLSSMGMIGAQYSLPFRTEIPDGRCAIQMFLRMMKTVGDKWEVPRNELGPFRLIRNTCHQVGSDRNSLLSSV